MNKQTIQEIQERHEADGTVEMVMVAGMYVHDNDKVLYRAHQDRAALLEQLRELKVAIESLGIKWYKRGESLTTWAEALEELEEI